MMDSAHWLLPTFGLGLGAIVGSFLALVAARWPAGRSFVGGRSRCDSCDRVLGPVDLVPLLSYILLGGRCRSCRAAIPASAFWIEAAAALIGMAAVALARQPLDLLWALFGWVLLLLAVLDLRHFWLPNALTLPLLGGGLAVSALHAWPPTDAAIGAAAGFAGLELVRQLHARMTGRDGMGAGDPRLFAAIGAWLGWRALPPVLLAAALVGLAAVAVAAMRGRDVSRQTQVSFGTCLAIAAIAWWLVVAAGSGVSVLPSWVA